MILVAFAALAVAGWSEVERRRSRFLDLVIRHGWGYAESPAGSPIEAWHLGQWERFDAATDRPWLPLGPEPPEPE